MTAKKEIEIKLEVPPAALRRLQKLPMLRAVKAPPKSTSQVSVYFDTDKRKLRKHGLSLRVRRIGDRFIQTVKATEDSNIFARDEWEGEITGPDPDFSQARGTGLDTIMSRKLKKQLRPIFETRVRRTLYSLVDDGSAIALTIDRGSIKTDGKSAPLCELELEVEKGNEADVFEAARQITQAMPAHLAMASKAERGYRLADGANAAAVRFVPPSLQPGVRARTGFQQIGRACVKQIVDNEAALVAGDPEGIHQMRVGLRRLRAAMSLCGVLLRDPETAAIKAELKWLTSELGPARELEVLINRVVAPVKQKHGDWDGIPKLSRQLSKRRKQALARAHDAVTSTRFRRLTVDLAAWLEIGQWTDPRDDLVRDLGEMRIETMACEQLTRRWRKIRCKCKAFAKLDTRRRHKLRIQAKKLRYAIDFFADLFSGTGARKQQKKFLKALKPVQDSLGDLNDIMVHEKRISALGLTLPQGHGRNAFAAGLLTGREDARFDQAVEVAQRALADFAEAEPFWR